jgi:hypothetical protein
MVMGAIALAILTAWAPAGARGRKAVDPRAVQARKACAAGHVEEGIELLARIVAESGDPNAVYNQARCYQQNGRLEEALARFQEYRRTKDLTAQERVEVEAHVRELEAAIKSKSSSKPTAVQTPPAAMASPSADPSPVGPTAPPPPLLPPPRPRRSSAVRLTAAALAAAGVAAVATGGYYGLRSRQIEAEIENQQGVIPNAIYQTRLRHGRQAERLQWIGYGAGAALLAGSVAVILGTRPRSGESGVLTATVQGGPNGGGILFSGRF